MPRPGGDRNGLSALLVRSFAAHQKAGRLMISREIPAGDSCRDKDFSGGGFGLRP